MNKEQYDAGMKVRREVLGDAYVDRSIATTDDINRDLQNLVNEYGWGATWARDTLDRRTRSFINIGMLTALNRPHELSVHLRGALNNGCTREEIAEVALQTAIYCGLPAALDTMRNIKRVFDEVDAEG